MAVQMPVIGLITDFSSRDYFIGMLRGVIKQINPFAEVIDICNDIESYGLLPASFVVEKNYRFFPEGTIFLVIVDPGVGTQRRMLLVEFDGRYFIGPDNGVLTPVLDNDSKIVRELDKHRFFLVSEAATSTFEARDKMAPAAAYLSAGIDIDELGTPVTAYITYPEYYPTASDGVIYGRLVYIDSFGNLMTNIPESLLSSVLDENGHNGFKADFRGREISTFHSVYGDAGKEGHLFMLIGSHGNLEIAMNQGSARVSLDARIGDEVKISSY